MTTTTKATFAKITRRDTTVDAYTSHDKAITISGVTYEPSAGYVPSAVERVTALQADNLQVLGIIDNANISKTDLLAGAYDGARVEIFEADWSNPAGGVTGYFVVGFFGSVQVIGEQYVINFIDLKSELQKPMLRTISLPCDADLGDTRCGVTLSAQTGTVTSVSGSSPKRIFVDTSRTEADGYFDQGKLTWTSGNNNGRVMDVKSYTAASDTIELYEPMPVDIQIGDGYSMTRGCDKTFTTCKDTFNNAQRHRGHPYLPGISDLIGGQTETS